VLGKGVSFPVDAFGIRLVDPEVSFQDGYFVVETSFEGA
jgi:hypothetical protein